MEAEAILPPDWKVRTRFSAGEVLGALEEVARLESFLLAVSHPGDARGALNVTLRWTGGNESFALGGGVQKEGTVPTRWTVGAEIPCRTEGLGDGEELALHLDRHYFRECIRALGLAEGDEAEIRSNGPLSPLMIRPAETEDRFTVLMPLHPSHAGK